MRGEDVPPGPLLVDTDVFSWITWQRGRFREFDDLVEGRILALSFATVAELRAGVLIGAWGDKRRRIIEERIAQYVVLTATDAVTHRFSEVYARFRNQLKGDGRQRHVGGCHGACPAGPHAHRYRQPVRLRTHRTEFPLVIIHPEISSSGTAPT